MKLAICADNYSYLESFMEYLESKENCPFELIGFTDIDKLLSALDMEQHIRIVVITEGMFSEQLEKYTVKFLVLDEGLNRDIGNAFWVDKYQPVGDIYKAIMELCLEEESLPPFSKEGKETRIIGFYSPIKRAMQTSFSLALGRSLSSRYKVLYVSFEQYAGLREFAQGDFSKDLFDLLYYLKEPAEKFAYRFSQVERRRGELSYIPPVMAGQNLVYITLREWLMFINRLKAMGRFDFILLDLSDCLQGIFEILRMCEKVFTVTVPERTAVGKLEHYEYLLQMYECGDVLDKTCRKTLPRIERLPDEGDLWTLDVWREFVRQVEIEDFGV